MSTNAVDTGNGRGRVALIAVLVLALGGVGVSVELTRIYHRANANRAHKSHCAISAKWDCDRVARSAHASFAGVPTSLWGAAGYVAIAFFAAWGAFVRVPRHWPLGFLSLNALGAIVLSLQLAIVSTFVLKVHCLYCTILYGVNGLLLAALIIAFVQRGVGPLQALKKDFALLFERQQVLFSLGGVGLAGLAALLLLGPQLGRFKPTPVKDIKVDKYVKKRPTTMRPGMAPPSSGMSPGTPAKPAKQPVPAWLNKHITVKTPSKGGDSPDIYIVEWADYECPACAHAHMVISQAMKKYPKRIKVFHRHLPLDKKCFRLMKRDLHKHACLAAATAICAQEQGRFWKMHEALWKLNTDLSRSKILMAAKGIGLDEQRLHRCLKSAAVAARIQDEINAGLKAGAPGTPYFVLGGPWVDPFKPEGVTVKLFEKLFAAIDKAKAHNKGKQDLTKKAATKDTMTSGARAKAPMKPAKP